MIKIFSFLFTSMIFLISSPGALAAKSFELKSSSFKDGTEMAKKHAGTVKTNANCIGENVSPELSWSGAPEGTKSFALIAADLQGRKGQGVVHWVVYGIPPIVTNLAEGEGSKPSSKYVDGKITNGMNQYSGPCPPPNSNFHHYIFTLYATDLEPSALKPGLSMEELLSALNGHFKEAVEIVGLFKHP